MDLLAEHDGVRQLGGSFYNKIIQDKDLKTVDMLSKLGSLTRVPLQLQQAVKAVLSGGYIQDHNRVVRFTDAQVNAYGVDFSIQQREVVKAASAVGISRPENLTAPETTLLSDEYDNTLVAPAPLALPDEYGNTVEWAADFQPQYALHINQDMFVHSIRTPDGELLLQGLDFIAQYGIIHLKKNPIAMFPSMQLLVQSCTIRTPNVLNYTLGVTGVYGAVDCILNYYRAEQSVRAFYHAAAQAGGFAVVKETCKILEKVRLPYGCMYVTTTGSYAVDFDHEEYEEGQTIPEGTIIGGELFKIWGPADHWDDRWYGVTLDHAIPVKGLIARNADIELLDAENKFRPALHIDPNYTPLTKYHQYLNETSPDPIVGMDPTGNAMLHYLDVVCANRAIVIYINKNKLPRTRQARLWTFIKSARPLGSVLFEVV